VLKTFDLKRRRSALRCLCIALTEKGGTSKENSRLPASFLFQPIAMEVAASSSSVWCIYDPIVASVFANAPWPARENLVPHQSARVTQVLVKRIH